MQVKEGSHATINRKKGETQFTQIEELIGPN